MGTGQTGGKHGSLVTKREPEPNNAGIRYEPKYNAWGTKRSFEGSGVRSYKYTRIIGGVKKVVTVRAHNVREADSIALRLGYRSSDRIVKQRNKNKRKR